MRKMTILDRILLLLTGLLAAYQVAAGVEGMAALPMICYTVAFGVLLVAGLLLIILGFDVLESPVVVIVSTAIPLSLSLGLAAQYLPAWTTAYAVFALLGFVVVAATRFAAPKLMAVLSLAVVHGISGLLIFALPILLALRGQAPAGFALVGVGGALIGVGGLLLSFLKTGKPILSRETILTILPLLLLLMSAAFVAGFAFG
ncbi:MAG: hypothetical protein L0Z70_09255 [Chloroflexi bacterium]|nr:hypothetical protein [Chloroflexota bacterium]